MLHLPKKIGWTGYHKKVNNIMLNKIYIVTHKAFRSPKSDLYVPIQVGKIQTGQDLGFLSDDTLDNIAYKNATFCELTALYWIWKNDKEADYIGLCHYRRYFTKNQYSNSEKYFITNADINKKISKHDIILPYEEKWIGVNVEEYYNLGAGRIQDIQKVKKILIKRFPEYINDLENVLNSNKASYRNMFIMSKMDLNRYCEWLFSILFELESSLNISSYNIQEKRVFGYLSEILLNVWIKHNKLSIAYCPIINTDTRPIKRMQYNIKKKIKFFIYNIGFEIKERG